MKTTMKMLRTGMVGLFLMAGVTTVLAQSTPLATQIPPDPMGTGNLGPMNPDVVGNLTTSREDLFADETPPLDFANELRNAILFFNPANNGSGLTLVASELEDKEDRNDPFTSYKWFYMGQNPADLSTPIVFNLGTEPDIPSTGTEKIVGTDANAHKLTVNGLTEGYHVFQVQGFMNPDGAEAAELCEPQSEFIVVYVLPQLTVNAEGASTSSFFQFCETDANPTDPATGQQVVRVSANVDFTSTTLTTTPNVAEFEKRYRWYAVKKDENGVYSTLDDNNKGVNPTSLTGVTLLNDPGSLTIAGQGSVIPDFFPQITTYGQYKILLEVEYTVKDRQYDVQDDEATNTRVRPHAIYRSFVQNGASDLEIIVTPQPGKPHITIEAVND